MKTIFTILFLLFVNAISVFAWQRNTEKGKLHELHQEISMSTNRNSMSPLKKIIISENFVSVPGLSEDFSWDVDLNDWQHDSNTTYNYDESGRVTEEIVQEPRNNLNVSRTTYSSDLTGNITEEISYVWGNNEWTPVSGDKSIYMINDDSQFSGIIEQVLENGIWINTTKTVYVLNSYAIPIGILTYNWEGDDWMIYHKIMNITWADWPTREMAAYTLQYWNNYNWFNAERYFTQYDGDNYTATTEIWDSVQWVNSTRETYLRTDNEEVSILENWTETGWENSYKYNGTIDTEGNPTGLKYSIWNASEWTTVMELFFDIEYNDTKDVTEMIFRYWGPELASPINASKYVFSNFQHIVTDVSDVYTLENVNVYPNPVSSAFTIQIDEPVLSGYRVNIVNLSGQTVFSNTFSSPRVSINAEYLISGMYLLTIKTDNGKIYNSKFLKN